MRDRLNYNHLLYFWTVVREGTVTRAAERLRLAQPTLSAQLRTLESNLGSPLFEREGRRLRLTDAGRVVANYAESIFSLGDELASVLEGHAGAQPLRLAVGVADVVPKYVAHEFLRPALRHDPPARLLVREASASALVTALATHDLDVVITDAPVDPSVRVKVFHHSLGEYGVVIMGRPKLAARLRRGFPQSLDAAPFLLPGSSAALRRSLESWFERCGIRPRIVGEFDDSALIKVFGMEGDGLFAVPEATRAIVARQFHVATLGKADGVTERYFAVTAERRVSHPVVVAMIERVGRSGPRNGGKKPT